MDRELIMPEIINIMKDIPAVGQNDHSAPINAEGIELDSLVLINILIRIEKKFSIDVSKATISRENFKSVVAITDFVHDLLEKKNTIIEQQAKPVL